MREPRLGLYAHQCPHFGYIIDETDVEFLKCLCFGETAGVLREKDNLMVELDLRRGVAP